MELVGIENTRIIFLTQVHRPSGQIYLPDAIASLVGRYSFLKSPNPDQAAFPFTFGIGKFENSQITEFSIYNDGLIVSSASDSDLLDAFLEDLLGWAKSSFELVELVKPEKYYESSIIVRSTSDISAPLAPRTELSNALAGPLKFAGIEIPIKFSGSIFDFDQAAITTKRKPNRLIVDRRVTVPFSQNVFYSQAPFRTKDHIAFLSTLERLSSDQPH
jgi:hypothetical protein